MVNTQSSDGNFEGLLPRPRQIRPLDGELVLTQEAQLLFTPGDDPSARFAAQRLSDVIAGEHGIRISPKAGQGDGFGLSLLPPGARPPGGQVESLLPEEGYRLSVDPHEVALEASDPKGLLWGAMTLRQLAGMREDKLVFPCAQITDWPRYRWRGFMIDAGRSPNSLAQIKRLVRICSTVKLNLLLFREGDDELNAVRYRTNPLGLLNPHALTMDEIAELIVYAGEFGVDVAPEIESLGHSTAKGYHYPHLVSGGFEQVYDEVISHTRKSHLNPDDPRSYQLLASIYDEWFAYMRCPLVHLGLDEVRLDAEAQAAHLARLLPLVDQIASRHGLDITPVVWADAPPTPPEYANRVVRCPWSYANREVSLANEHLLRQELDRLSAPGCRERVLMAGGSGSLHQPYTKSDDAAAVANLADWARWGRQRDNFIGLVAVQWHGNMLDDWLPDFLAAADFAWNPPEDPVDTQAELANIRAHLSRLEDAAHSKAEEVDRPAWDAIWLREGRWHEDIMSGRRFSER